MSIWVVALWWLSLGLMNLSFIFASSPGDCRGLRAPAHVLVWPFSFALALWLTHRDRVLREKLVRQIGGES